MLIFIAVDDVVVCRDCPQMVQLGRIPSEFDVARMRDSFLRQFLEQASVDLASAPSTTSPACPAVASGDTTAAPRIASTLGPGKDVPILSTTHAKSMSSPMSRHQAVADIVRYILLWLLSLRLGR